MNSGLGIVSKGWVKNNLVELALRFGLDLADLIEQNPPGRRPYGPEATGIASYFEDFANDDQPKSKIRLRRGWPEVEDPPMWDRIGVR